jgi:hypothetical protein
MSKEIKLTISPYEWEGKEEFTYEVRGFNIYHSKVGFKTYKEAEKECKLKLEELNQNKVDIR